ncbi:DUF397 domain-containing protein [Actinomadura sp. NAK00032]|uniref:DUF397 domain-containing protein n=1 Tax=Actinomadura sp. NAK00032 TaxID=2742128 RepID=UPI00159046CE|nr:DUF397 domain-containing protein [Actinomadura sp. NAK00032]QKW32714.1 DUF397 domain-containing protein [Actinomadura sp. NAK00032]
MTRWRKSSHSGSYPETCVECAALPLGRDRAVRVRDSTDPDGAHLVLSHAAWDALLVQLKGGGSRRSAGRRVRPATGHPA